MYRYDRSSKIFSKGSISQKFNTAFSFMKSFIENESEDYLLNVNQTEYINHITNNYLFDIPIIQFEDVCADSYEDDIPPEFFSHRFDVQPGQTYRKEIIQFIIPVNGNIELLNYSPASVFTLGVSEHFHIKGKDIISEFINFTNDGKNIKQDFDNEVQGIHRNYDALIKDISKYNNSLKAEIEKIFNQRKNTLLQKNDLMSSLGIPLKKNSSTVSTFSIPQPKLREKITIKPIATEKGFKPEPTLDENNYKHILKLINDVGKNFERMPSVYKEKEEEDLRDHILMILDPNFEFGSASGETFNKSGKTDIQLRFDSSVVFISECKFWSGVKGYLKTISQLLNYLTWRDTKASIVIFVRQKDFSDILEKVKNSTQEHDNYLSFINSSDENWFNYRFHINGDENREVKLAVQLFHLPK